MTDIEQLKEIYLTDVDEETRAENLALIEAWELALTANDEFASWLDHDVTKDIVAKARETYTDLAYVLATNRALTAEQRQTIYAQQDAMHWLFSLADRDPKRDSDRINAEIKDALKRAA